jgi:hypothetical protein
MSQGKTVETRIEYSHGEDLRVAVYDPDESQIDEVTRFADGRNLYARATNTGTHYIEVYGNGDASGPYDLVVDTSWNDEYESNDSIGAAASVEDGVYYDLQINDGESDFFAVNMDKGKQLDVEARFVHDVGNLDLTVYDPEENEIDDSASTTDGESLRVVAESGGTHYIEVAGEQRASNSYTLDVDTAWDDQFEPNDGFDSAESLLGTYSDLQINDGGSDFFKTTATSGDSVTATIRFDQDLGDLDLVLYDPDENQVDASQSTDDDETVSTAATQNGEYYVEVSGYAGSSAPYGLTLTVV